MTEQTAANPKRPAIPVALSSASVYPLSVHDAFAVAHDLGYDGLEVMVTNNVTSQDPQALQTLSERYRIPVLAVHAPTLLLTQQVWGSAWSKVERSVDMAGQLGAGVVVVHPPFRWQSDYAESFSQGVRDLADSSGIRIAVENMYPWRMRGREAKAYLPHWDPIEQDYDDVTWDLSHASTAGVASLEGVRALAGRLRHLHLTDGSGSNRDEHLVPGHGDQQAAEVLQYLAGAGFDGTVVAEISTRKAKAAGEREDWLSETLRFARQHLGQAD
ncbi:sugar phosphate isomerase/epimerase family protein [Arthrobacter russicus]|uniref:Sugar phosphate isomerase/epimerase n=1 Tax=Arthrobacter russicus TaxID=172040 RepID=A0ABU1JE84_9MICC|nr:sugar phosphate isomerase/epimerase [Arthrobacter russicus]MDN5667364.1 sugar phosphate isomerase/epimerase [Renibacterium salmoninarum]MDR6270181.1 sugar phosphate isomerase/epimerase [Arthrobacter russicus]